MTFLEHLNELTKTLKIVFGAIFVNFVFFFSFGFKSFTIGSFSWVYPYPTLDDSFSVFIFREIWQSLIPTDVGGVTIQPYASLGGGIMTLVHLSFFLSLKFSMPLILWEFGKFFKPALKPNERSMLIKIIIPATLLFVCGSFFAYFIILPFTIKFLLHLIVGLDAQALITADSFVKFVILFIMAFGFAFELPIVMYGLSMLGVVSSEFWKKNWRYAFIAMIIFGGVITPDGSGITQLMIAVPMMGLYFMGYTAIVLKERKKKREKA
jgi:sec-independent protein translocase protein TatC